MSEGRSQPKGEGTLPPERESGSAAKGEALEAESTQESGEPPVVARLMVEIRSDGSRTLARGALEDVQSGQRAAVEAKGDSPLELATSLAKVMARAPLVARRAAGALRPGSSPPSRSRGVAKRVARRFRGALSRR